jgi:hypothetical protein
MRFSDMAAVLLLLLELRAVKTGEAEGLRPSHAAAARPRCGRRRRRRRRGAEKALKAEKSKGVSEKENHSAVQNSNQPASPCQV